MRRCLLTKTIRQRTLAGQPLRSGTFLANTSQKKGRGAPVAVLSLFPSQQMPADFLQGLFASQVNPAQILFPPLHLPPHPPLQSLISPVICRPVRNHFSVRFFSFFFQNALKGFESWTPLTIQLPRRVIKVFVFKDALQNTATSTHLLSTQKIVLTLHLK